MGPVRERMLIIVGIAACVITGDRLLAQDPATTPAPESPETSRPPEKTAPPELPSIEPCIRYDDHAWDLRFSPGGEFFAVGGMQGEHHGFVAHLGKGRLHGVPAVEKSDGANHVSWSADGRWVAFTEKYGDFRIVERWTGEPVRFPHEIVGARAMQATFSPKDPVIAIYRESHGIRVYSTETFEQLAQLPSRYSTLAWTPDGTRLVIATRAAIQVWDWRNEKAAPAVATPKWRPSALAVDGSGARLAWSAGRDVHVLDLATEETVCSFTHESALVRALAFLPDGRLVTAGCGKFTPSRDARVWDLGTGQPVLDLPMPKGLIFAADVSDDGTWLAVGGEAGIRMWLVGDLRPDAASGAAEAGAEAGETVGSGGSETSGVERD